MEIYMIKKMRQLPTLYLCIALAITLSSCKKNQLQTVPASKNCEYTHIPLGHSDSGSISIFDEDVEAFVLEEEVENPFNEMNNTALAFNQPEPCLQEFTFEQLDAKDDVQTVYFAYDSKKPKAGQQETLNAITKKVQEWCKEGKKICCKGHSCRWHGTKAYNIALSANRAEIIANEIAQRAAVSKNAIKVFGVGNEEPITCDNTQEGQAPNRRVEIYALAA